MKKYRVFLALLAVVLAAALGLVLAQGNAEPEAPFLPEEGIRLAVATDLHYLAPQLYDNGAYYTTVSYTHLTLPTSWRV